MKRLLLLKQIPLSPDFGRLCLRVLMFGLLFLKHGAEKLFTFSNMEQTFVAHHLDPIHIGPIPSLVFAAFADGICSLLIVCGLFTRAASAILFINVFVVWSLVDHFKLFGPGTDHGEVIVLYLAGLLMLFFSGAGKYSVDALIDAPEVAEHKPSKLAARA